MTRAQYFLTIGRRHGMVIGGFGGLLIGIVVTGITFIVALPTQVSATVQKRAKILTCGYRGYDPADAGQRACVFMPDVSEGQRLEMRRLDGVQATYRVGNGVMVVAYPYHTGEELAAGVEEISRYSYEAPKTKETQQ